MGKNKETRVHILTTMTPVEREDGVEGECVSHVTFMAVRVIEHT